MPLILVWEFTHCMFFFKFVKHIKLLKTLYKFPITIILTEREKDDEKKETIVKQRRLTQSLIHCTGVSSNPAYMAGFASIPRADITPEM